MKTLANLERELGSIAPKRREDVVGDKLMKFLKSNGDYHVFAFCFEI
jgi:hypothetical protein